MGITDDPLGDVMYRLDRIFLDMISYVFQFPGRNTVSPGRFTKACAALEAIYYGYMGNMIAAVFLVDLSDQSFTLAEFDININVRWFGAIWIKESFKWQVVFQGVCYREPEYIENE